MIVRFQLTEILVTVNWMPFADGNPLQARPRFGRFGQTGHVEQGLLPVLNHYSLSRQAAQQTVVLGPVEEWVQHVYADGVLGLDCAAQGGSSKKFSYA